MTSQESLALVQKAITYHQQGKLDKAERLYRKVLKTDQNNVDALHFLGVLQFNRNELSQAFKYIKKALTLDPYYSDAHMNLGNLYLQEANYQEAKRCYEKAIELEPDKILAASNLGILYRHLGNLIPSETLLTNVVQAMPGWAEAHYHLASTLHLLHKNESAIDSLQKAIELKPTFFEAYNTLLIICYMQDNNSLAENVFKQWESVNPKNPVLEHLKLAFSGKAPKRASQNYISEVFDSYANSFESNLEKLEYSGPKLIGETLHKLLGDSKATLRILDAGCGTGLAHQELKPFASKLFGLDLSSKMLEIAKQKKDYDRLIQGDIEAELNKFDGYFDVIVSIDTLIYLGDLNRTFAGVRKALKKGGLFIATLEANNTNEDDYVLPSHGRYEHGKEYIERLLTQYEFKNTGVMSVVTRKELEKGVEGWLFYGFFE